MNIEELNIIFLLMWQKLQNQIQLTIIVSSGFADPNSSGDYLKNKGEVEEELKKVKFYNLGIMRPAFLMGNRKEKRIGEKVRTYFFLKLFHFIFRKN